MEAEIRLQVNFLLLTAFQVLDVIIHLHAIRKPNKKNLRSARNSLYHATYPKLLFNNYRGYPAAHARNLRISRVESMVSCMLLASLPSALTHLNATNTDFSSLHRGMAESTLHKKSFQPSHSLLKHCMENSINREMKVGQHKHLQSLGLSHGILTGCHHSIVHIHGKKATKKLLSWSYRYKRWQWPV